MMQKVSLTALPRRTLIGVTLFAVTSLLLAAGAWYAKSAARADVSRLEDALKAREMLEPYIESIRRRQESVRRMTGDAVVYARPTSVTEMLRILQEIARDVDLDGVQFVPDALSAVGDHDIRMVGRGAGTTEAFRRLVIELAHQPWVTRVESVKVVAGDSVHTFEIAVRAAYGRSAAGGGEVK